MTEQPVAELQQEDHGDDEGQPLEDVQGHPSPAKKLKLDQLSCRCRICSSKFLPIKFKAGLQFTDD
jgi:hypothetical protein